MDSCHLQGDVVPRPKRGRTILNFEKKRKIRGGVSKENFHERVDDFGLRIAVALLVSFDFGVRRIGKRNRGQEK